MSEFTLSDFLLAILVLVGACIGGYWSYRGSHDVIKKQLENEQKNIAKAIDIDLKNISTSIEFNTQYTFYKKTKDYPAEIFEKIIPSELEKKFYNDKNLLYFVFKQDIAKLDHELSFDIYEFYNDLFIAEDLRKLLLKSQNPHVEMVNSDAELINELIKDVADIKKEVLNKKYELFRKLILDCGDNIPELREKLKEVYNS